MIANYIFAFVLPWLIAIFHLYRKEKLILIILSPIASCIAFAINDISFHYKFWEIYPFNHKDSFSAIPFNLGLYPVLGSYLIYYIKRFKNQFCVVIAFSFLTTLLEYFFVIIGRVKYNNGWNEFWTLISYIFAYLCCAGYYFLFKLNEKK